MSRLLAAALVLIAAPAAAQARYFAAMDDVPLPPGFVETDAGFVFDGAEGRIVDAQASGALSVEATGDFYRAALPPLGWAYSPGGDALVFQRGRERLTLRVSASGAVAHVEARLITQLISIDPGDAALD